MPATPTALLAMDFQQGILARLGDEAGTVVAAAARAVAAARDAGIPVVFVRIAFRPGYPEISPRNPVFAPYLGIGDGMTLDSPITQIVPELAPQPGEVVVVKTRYSAFAGSGLDIVLRGLGAEHLVLAGVSTSGVVLSTLRQAVDLDFATTVLADACADRDAQVHAMLTERVFARHSAVVSVADWSASL